MRLPRHHHIHQVIIFSNIYQGSTECNIFILSYLVIKVVMVLPDPFRGAQRNSAETQQSGNAPSSAPKINNQNFLAETK